MHNLRHGSGILAQGAARYDLPAEQVERWGWERRVPTAPVWQDHPGKPADAEAIWSMALEALQLDPPGRLTRPVAQQRGPVRWAGRLFDCARKVRGARWNSDASCRVLSPSRGIGHAFWIGRS